MIGPSSICPWWLASALDNPIRRLIHNPEEILGGYIESGQTVLDLGCGSGTFTIFMARMVGEMGKAIRFLIKKSHRPIFGGLGRAGHPRFFTLRKAHVIRLG